jgi:hypothetical protein
MMALIAGMAGCDGHTPPSEDLEIRDWYDLDAVRDNLEGHHILMNDLDSNTDGYEELAGLDANGGKGWQPIGTFTGSLDGQGYEIMDLFVSRPDEDGMGLFGFVDVGGVIQDVGAVDADVTGYRYVGGLAGWSQGTVSNSYSTGSVRGNDYIGGLVGWNQGTVSSSFWDIEASRQDTSAGGTGKITVEIQDITTFINAGWNIIEVPPGVTVSAYTWNIVDGVTYPFLSWQP